MSNSDWSIEIQAKLEEFMIKHEDQSKRSITSHFLRYITTHSSNVLLIEGQVRYRIDIIQKQQQKQAKEKGCSNSEQAI